MNEFECNDLNDSTVMMLYLDRSRVFMNPDYQRQGEVWTTYKKQLLIDSLINSFDIPKLYFHEFDKAQKIDGVLRKYAIVDGKQRLSAIWDFMDGKFPLGNDIEYMRDPKIKLKGLTYQQLSLEHPTIQARFTGRKLSVVTIRTNDTDLIEDMFSRLNEAVPLNAAEKRNALGGPIPKVMRALVKNAYFEQNTSISDRRYRHHDLACKFLLTEEENKITETKKAKLDAFVLDFAKRGLVKKAHILEGKVKAHLDEMNLFFKKHDPLLRSPSSSMTYYILFRNGVLARPSKCGVARSVLEDFENELVDNRERAEDDIGEADFALLEYDRLNQSPNDASAIDFRVTLLRTYIEGKKKKIPKKRPI
jgi:hypothetical protein